MDRKINIVPIKAKAPQLKFNTGADWMYHDQRDTTEPSEGAKAEWKTVQGVEDEESELIDIM